MRQKHLRPGKTPNRVHKSVLRRGAAIHGSDGPRPRAGVGKHCLKLPDKALPAQTETRLAQVLAMARWFGLKLLPCSRGTCSQVPACTPRKPSKKGLPWPQRRELIVTPLLVPSLVRVPA